MAYKPYDDIKIPKGYGAAARKAIGQDIVDHIVKRSLSGKDKNNKAFPKYSESYKKSLDFKLGGKSASKVNLRLSFEMLNSLTVRSQTQGNVRVGIQRGDQHNSKKAQGNETGEYGQKSPIPGKKREFIGISNNDLNAILKKYPLKDKSALKGLVAERLAIQKEAQKSIDDVNLERGDGG